MRMYPRLASHPDIGDNGRQPFDDAVSWQELRRPEAMRIHGEWRRAAVANTNEPAPVEQVPARARPAAAAFGYFDR